MADRLTPFQTVGPFFDFGLIIPGGETIAQPATPGRHIAVEGTIRDGAGEPVPDAIVEIWQANAAGAYRHPADDRATADSIRPSTGSAGSPTDRRRAVRVHDGDAGPRARAGRRTAGAAPGGRRAGARHADPAGHADVLRRRAREHRGRGAGARAGSGGARRWSPRPTGTDRYRFDIVLQGKGRRCSSMSEPELISGAQASRAEARLQAMLDVEAALAEAEAALGVIPAAAATAIRAAARVELLRCGGDRRRSAPGGQPRDPARAAADANGSPRTTRRPRDTCTGARPARTSSTPRWSSSFAPRCPRSLRDLRRAAAAAAGHARRHADTLMPGRTWLQQATPITFGLKAAGWLDALAACSRRSQRALDAARWYCSSAAPPARWRRSGRAGSTVAAALGARLDLPVPALPWHAHRDRARRARLRARRRAAARSARSPATSALLAQTEVGEAHERPAEAGGSSTMPHKRNPVRAAVALAAAVRAPGLVATMLSAMPQEHERGLGGWQAEWDALPGAGRVSSADAARAVAEALEGLVVDAERDARQPRDHPRSGAGRSGRDAARARARQAAKRTRWSRPRPAAWSRKGARSPTCSRRIRR